MIKNYKNPVFKVLALIFLVATPLHAFEQGSYFIFDISKTEGNEKKAAVAGRIKVSAKVFATAKKDKTPEVADRTTPQKSEFDFSSSFATGESSVFSTDIDLVRSLSEVSTEKIASEVEKSKLENFEFTK